MTSELVEVAGYVIAIELDDRLIPILRTKFALHDNFEVIHLSLIHIFDMSPEEVIAELKEMIPEYLGADSDESESSAQD